tara:strand:- start:718 stop:1308 length:591 start_codon:yes stop_codon:yes gene_type:complete
MTVSQALSQFIADYENQNKVLTEVYDSEWRSPCEIGSPFTDNSGVKRIRWRPIKQNHQKNEIELERFERAINMEIHPDIKEYYGSYWSAGLEANTAQGAVSLILLWNNDDAERLIENLVGHTIERHRLKAPLTTFFACTEQDSELILTIDNKSGRVLLEKPGKKEVEIIARSLKEFLCDLTPADASRHPEQTAKHR